jgi:hypothetical protein
VSNFEQTPAINEHIFQTSSPFRGAAPKPPVQWRGAMNDARGYRDNAAHCPLADKSCQPCYHTLVPLLLAFARPADEAIDALLVAQ